MAEISEEVKEIIGRVRLAFTATASKAGKPNVSPKGSFRVLDREHVMFADLSSPRTIANLKENPQLSAILFDPSTRKGCRIWGEARILDSGGLFDSITAELAPRKVTHIVTVKVEDQTTI